ncbi:MAG TPA: STM4011 family radical SAM protein [Roseiflexaceae bacterium]|nr:STM4011 family radical SAM protein [Roseiflexaceae bacterium]
MDLSILYRGPLSSCNYGCDYCPFAKHTETAEEHARDAAALERFVGWVAARPPEDRIGVLFTPWGEALIRRRYQRALAALSQMPAVVKVAIQTNLACRLDWVEQCDKSRLALWATFHPTQIERGRFLAKCQELIRRGVRFSVGVVGMKEHAAEIAALRAALPPEVYLWINAYKRVPDYYTPEELAHFTEIDPLFPLNTRYHPSQGRSCRAGASVISVDGDGTMRRCHFIKTPIGNLYAPDFAAALAERPCTNATCGCHIGYVHMDELGLYRVFGSGVLERVPDDRSAQPASLRDQIMLARSSV